MIWRNRSAVLNWTDSVIYNTEDQLRWFTRQDWILVLWFSSSTKTFNLDIIPLQWTFVLLDPLLFIQQTKNLYSATNACRFCCCKSTYLYALKHSGLQINPLRCPSFCNNMYVSCLTSLTIFHINFLHCWTQWNNANIAMQVQLPILCFCLVYTCSMCSLIF